jgi:hypothetical protein
MFQLKGKIFIERGRTIQSSPFFGKSREVGEW